jgi:hypothetical protein
MNLTWENIAEQLRAELAEYGALLRLLDEQQQLIFQRDPDALLQVVQRIEEQTRLLEACRTRREATVAEYVRANALPAGSLRALLPELPAEARPLLEALINDENALLFRVRRVSRQNQGLLTRAVELRRDTLAAGRPQAFTKTYSPAGRVEVEPATAASTLHIRG